VDLKLLDADATAEERRAVDAVAGPPASARDGEDRAAGDGHAHGGFRAAQERRHLLLPALNAVQSAIGWISRGAMNYICERLIVPPAEAYAVASFYALLSTESRPERVAHVCDDIVCRRRGALELLDDADEGNPIAGSPCLGQCDRAPAVFVQVARAEDLVIAPADDRTIAAVSAGADPAPPPVSVPQSGESGLRLLSRIGVVEPSDLAAYRRSGGYAALGRAIDIGDDAVIAEVEASGLRGRGGAAFPMGVKWRSVAGAAATTRYVICNADESEPGTFKDRVLMEGDPFAVIESLTIAGMAVGAEQGYIYIRAEYPQATARLRSAIEDAEHAGLLGADVAGSGRRFGIEIRRGGGAYICGEETALMNSIEGRRGEPRNKPPFPTQAGLFGRPTVINNVETLLNVPLIVTDGGDAFARIGTPDSTGTKLFCLSGDVGRPGLYEVPFGMSLRELLELAGTDASGLRCVLLGGAAGTFVGAEHFDMPLTFEGARAHGVSLGSGVVMGFGPDTDFGDVLRRIAAFFRDESCGQCVPCRVGTVRQEELLARHLAGAPFETELFADIARVMEDASICGLGHTAAGAIRSAVALDLLERA
jgi:NADH-quinone oxidoreductase subunit F